MPTGKVVIGLPEVKKLLQDGSITIRLKPGMDAVELKLSMIAQGELRSKKDSGLDALLEQFRNPVGKR